LAAREGRVRTIPFWEATEFLKHCDVCKRNISKPAYLAFEQLLILEPPAVAWWGQCGGGVVVSFSSLSPLQWRGGDQQRHKRQA
jgi:hypothetical protein